MYIIAGILPFAYIIGAVSLHVVVIAVSTDCLHVGLLFTLKTHADIFEPPEGAKGEGKKITTLVSSLRLTPIFPYHQQQQATTLLNGARQCASSSL